MKDDSVWCRTGKRRDQRPTIDCAGLCRTCRRFCALVAFKSPRGKDPNSPGYGGRYYLPLENGKGEKRTRHCQCIDCVGKRRQCGKSQNCSRHECANVRRKVQYRHHGLPQQRIWHMQQVHQQRNGGAEQEVDQK